MMSRTQPPSLDVGEGLGVGVGFFVEVGFGFGLPRVGLGLGVAVELGAGAVVAWLGDGAGAAVVGTDEVGSEAGSTTPAACGRVAPGRLAPVVPVVPLGRVAGAEVSAEPQPSSEVVLAQSPPGSPGKPLDDIASSLQLSPDQ
jgi:hypothetical protein